MKISTLKSLAHSYLKASNAVSMIEEVQGEVQELWVNSVLGYDDDAQIEELQDQLDEAYSQACALEESLDQAGRDACAILNKSADRIVGRKTRKTSHRTWEQIKNYGTAKF